MLEGLCHIAFVLGHETDQSVGTAQQRAECLAVAREREAQMAQATALPGSVPEGNVEEARLRVQFYETLHERGGCPFIADKAFRDRPAPPGPSCIAPWILVASTTDSRRV